MKRPYTAPGNPKWEPDLVREVKEYFHEEAVLELRLE